MARKDFQPLFLTKKWFTIHPQSVMKVNSRGFLVENRPDNRFPRPNFSNSVVEGWRISQIQLVGPLQCVCVCVWWDGRRRFYVRFHSWHWVISSSSSIIIYIIFFMIDHHRFAWKGNGVIDWFWHGLILSSDTAFVRIAFILFLYWFCWKLGVCVCVWTWCCFQPKINTEYR